MAKGASWDWQAGGEIDVTKPDIAVALHDLTGFAGRCDAILFAKDPAFQPPQLTRRLPREDPV